jgi:hypothetical protein
MKRNKKNTINGILEKGSPLSKCHTIDELLGETVSSPFKQSNLEDFEKSLAMMNLQEMTELGTKVDIMPIHDRRIMKDRLVRRFKQLTVPKPLSKPVLAVSLSKENEALVKKILSEGR